MRLNETSLTFGWEKAPPELQPHTEGLAKAAAFRPTLFCQARLVRGQCRERMWLNTCVSVYNFTGKSFKHKSWASRVAQ